MTMSKEASGSAPEQSPRIVLLVEDNAIVAMNTEEQLHEIGAEQVVLATSVAEALAKCEAQSFDFALLDFNLGDETSIDLARWLRGHNVPFAFASGFGDQIELPADLDDCLILSKPYFLAELAAVLCKR
jgi:CheY-like chemotaxis protein